MESAFETVSTKVFETGDLTLTCKGLSCVNWNCGDDDFQFVAGDDKVLRVHSVLAEFLSPKIAQIRKCDPFCYVYTFKNSDLFDAFESLVPRLVSEGSVSVERSNFVTLLRVAQELENSELLSSLLGMINTERLTLEEAVRLLRAGVDIGTLDWFRNLRDFIASNFCSLDDEILDNLDLETAQLILSSPSLQIEDEDSLFDFIISRSESDLSFTSLLEFVYFEYLSVESIEEFSSFVTENLLENMSAGIWTRICARLALETSLKKNPRASPGVMFNYDELGPLDGIIAHLTREFGGNVHDKNIVKVTASSAPNNCCPPKNAVDLGTDSIYVSDNETNAWICYEFKKHSVIPKSYSIMSYDSGPGYHNLKSWIIEVSKDGAANSWMEIDRRENNNDLNDTLVTANFKISHVPSEGFRFIRLRQIGKDHKGGYCIKIAALELFGVLCD